MGRSTVRLELDEAGGSNLEQIRRRAAKQPERPTAPGDEQSEPARISIARLRFEGGEVWLHTPDGEEPELLELPAFELRGVGGTEGVTGGELGRRVIAELTRRSLAAAAGHELGRALERELGEAGKAAGEMIRDLFD